MTRTKLILSAAALALLAPALALAQHGREARDPQARLERYCAKTPDAGRTDRRADRMAQRLTLTDAQKAAFKDLADTRAKARADARTSVCAGKPDLKTMPGRLTFMQTRLEARLAALKAEMPKVQAFYATLNADQKAKMDAARGGGERGERGEE